MLRPVLRRLFAAVPLILGVLTLTFVLVETAPGSPADLLLGERPVPEEVRRSLERAYGLDRPPVERYVRWLGSLLLRGELGWSLSHSRPVARVLADALPATLILAGAGLLVCLSVGMVLGAAAATWRDRWPDRAIQLGSLAVFGMPTFWLGMMAILALAYAVPLFPASSMRSVDARSWPAAWRVADLMWHAALPAVVLGLRPTAVMARFVRSGVVGSLVQDFVRAAKARGSSSGGVLLKHALPNALLPAINLVGLSLPSLVSGSLIVEVVFAWPGMGRLAYEAILAQDVPLVLATTLLASVLVILGSLLADLAMAIVDPRVRLA